ncbi:MAG TPA: translation initiation factor IF-3, partial [Pyrinomonadaceae bacterium]
KQKEAKKKQVTITVKEVKFRPGTDDHDYNFKMKHARDWLTEGDKVKATIFFRGREITHRELGAELLQRLEKDLAEFGEVEARPRMEGNQMFFIFTPKKQKTSGGGGGGGSAKSDGGAKPAAQTLPIATETGGGASSQ